MRDFHLRLIVTGVADIEALQSISVEARSRYRSIAELAFVADSPPLDRERFDACRILAAVAGETGAICGFELTRPLDGLLYLDNISVASAAGGAGVGKALLAETWVHARSQGFRAVTLTTFRSPKWNGSWFRRYGFRTMPEMNIGSGLRAVMERQALSFDPITRETLCKRCSQATSVQGMRSLTALA
jgi:N-acetylglutamate synthase-like GNAT family acetyltransferase